MAQITSSPIPTLATEQGRSGVRMMKGTKLDCLEPDIVTAIVEGRNP